MWTIQSRSREFITEIIQPEEGGERTIQLHSMYREVEDLWQTLQTGLYDEKPHPAPSRVALTVNACGPYIYVYILSLNLQDCLLRWNQPHMD